MVDGRLAICWFDRQNIIISEEFSIFDEPQVLGALIVFLSRFTLEHWGIILYPDSNGCIKLINNAQESDFLTMEMNTKPIYHRPSLCGRGTLVVKGEFGSSAESTRSVVVKISHPETQRRAERYFIDKGIQELPHISAHLPKVFYDSHIGPDTQAIRASLHLEKRDGTRKTYIIAFEELYDMTSLEADAFLRAWTNCLSGKLLALSLRVLY